ncbi:hypothetical protein N7448_008185 [Penicillium atrosanguineum]|uniref:Fungal lipase-like domain-containing protein n=1 Tax=Penicillium atrosanguineum TaxID=1132637 RepID=A0A9W9GR41_9EURO|nr:uncharacterized protein N7443_000801 [Penicillium atrosanguineum]KAJ5127406.1 hypothetical protein N7448_008185 [Penicillium atrosanguineum]KAJ5147609.1 hypothetical protein N7526_000961 [Penicillium atrosanguineum]KAJ5313917.1 hypothetical protein N7443_000801 [Penicillium atrosanguineum]KAJ5331087.1 hypothetical protein N7476_000870 [Penicillium atrosanguineum]
MLFQKLVLTLSWAMDWGIQPVYSQAVPPERCATGVHAILARGQGPGDHLNVMVSIQNLILQLIPGSSSVALPYKHGLEDHRIAAADGARMMQQYVREYVVSCPNSKIFLMGYSLGGIVLMDALCGTSSLWLYPVPALEPSYNRNVIAAATYGEETYLPGESWDVGSCTDGVGLYPRLHPEWCDPYAPSLRAYCDEGDMECCLNQYPPNDSHFLYIFKYNLDVLRFIQRRLNDTRSR